MVMIIITAGYQGRLPPDEMKSKKIFDTIFIFTEIKKVRKYKKSNEKS
jgi:hypothetical protein